MPSSKPKLEDLLIAKEAGLPAKLSRLLVVKGAELSFSSGTGSGISEDILREFLSGQGILDDIQADISKTVRGAKIDQGEISGSYMGEIKRRGQYSDRLRSYDDLFTKIETVYSGGERQALKNKIKELELALTEQEKAKRHKAYQTHEELQNLQNSLVALPQADLKVLEDEFEKIQDSQRRIDRQQEKLTDLKRQSKHYGWLEEAITLYETLAAQGQYTTSRLLPIGIMVALILALGFSFIGLPQGTFVMVVFVVLLGWLYIRQYRKALDRAGEMEEIRKLEDEFQNRFGQTLSGLPQMRELKKSMEDAHFGSKTVTEDLEAEVGNLNKLQDPIKNLFHNLTGAIPEPEMWSDEIRKLVQAREELQEQLKQCELKLVALGVSEGEYLPEPVAVEYAKQEIEALQDQLDQAEATLTEKTNELNSLKQQISGITRDDISTSWDSLIQNLQKKRVETSAYYRNETAKIIAGILVNQQLDIIRAEEEEKIRGKLESPLVCQPIYDITGRYKGVHYDNGTISLSDEFGQFSLSDLSTGAKEQVLLGLRLGFASHLLGKDRLFLLLDDAFQHADWTRRERLLDKMINLAKSGWQIIYFTMDDHIRDLFNDVGSKHFPGQYQYYELSD